MSIEYKINHPISADQFISLLADSTLGERRPIQDRECMAGMISNSNLTVSAWDSEKLVGISRCMTDFHYACYLSDLAVSEKLLEHTKTGQVVPEFFIPHSGFYNSSKRIRAFSERICKRHSLLLSKNFFNAHKVQILFKFCPPQLFCILFVTLCYYFPQTSLPTLSKHKYYG